MITSTEKIGDDSVSKEALLSENAKLRKENAELKAMKADPELPIEMIAAEHSDVLVKESGRFNTEKRSLLRRIIALNRKIFVIEVITEHSDMLMEESGKFNAEKRSLLRRIIALNLEIFVLEKELEELKCKGNFIKGIFSRIRSVPWSVRQANPNRMRT